MHALVIGAGAVGESAALHLRTAGWNVTATMRRDHADVAARLEATGVRVARFDLERDSIEVLLSPDVAAVVLTPILSLSVGAAPRLTKVQSVIAFSSNNVAIDPTALTYVKLAAAEAELCRHVPHATILRPTLIYGDPRLRTLPSIMRWARALPVLPVPGSGRALQQPVFYDDLGRAASSLAQSSAYAGTTFALGGPDVVSMRALFEAAARAAGAKPLLMPTPRWALLFGAALFGSRFPFDAAQIARVETDRVAGPQTPLPPELAPRTTLADGLAKLAAAMR
ncbi:MAG: hypothetical protein ABUL73_02030 [Alphaproteobacteria bacterium]